MPLHPFCSLFTPPSLLYDCLLICLIKLEDSEYLPDRDAAELEQEDPWQENDALKYSGEIGASTAVDGSASFIASDSGSETDLRRVSALAGQPSSHP